jgi:hypothetical protein
MGAEQSGEIILAAIRFDVRGIPRPQGSKRIVRGRMIESARGHADWRRTVAMAAMAARQEREGEWPIERPVRVSIDFLVPGRPDARPVIDMFALKEQARRRDECGASVSVWEA